MARTIAVVGAGVVGDRVARLLGFGEAGAHVVAVEPRVGSLGGTSADVVVLAHPSPHVAWARTAIAGGHPVVSVSGVLDDVRQLCDLDDLARDAGVPLVVGAAQSPGLTDLVARFLAGQLASCDEIHLAVHGTAGPACAHEHHRALAGHAVALHDGVWITRRSGSGRELCWFPEPVGAYDCYRAELASPYLLGTVFPEVTRISARLSANRRDRLTAHLPMLTPPHPEGGVGAVRVEVRGTGGSGERVTLVAGIAELVGTTAAATAATFAVAALDGSLPAGVVTAADPRLDTRSLLEQVERFGVRLQEFTGIPTTA